jgi:uncharacterized membrane protein YkvA (DUF1232 family)
VTHLLSAWQRRAGQLKRQTYAVYLAIKDPRTPWYARVAAGLVVAYAFSPIDLIPDFIPVLGYLDDLIIIPLGIALTVKLIPPDVLAEARARADEVMAGDRPTSRAAAVAIVAIWLVAAAAIIAVIVNLLRR